MRYTYMRYLNEEFKPEREEYEYDTPYVAYTVHGEVVNLNSIDEYNKFFIDEDKLEQIVFEESVNYIERFSKTQYNKQVYSFCFYVDSCHGELFPIINTEESFKKTIDDYKINMSFEELYGVMGIKYGQDHLWKCYNKKFSNNFSKLMTAYYSIKFGGFNDSRVSRDFVFPSRIFMYSILDLVAFKVLKRLKSHFNLLNKTDKFMLYIAEHDEDHAMLKRVMRALNGNELFYYVFPNEKVYDDEFNKVKDSLKQKSMYEQIDFWVRAYAGKNESFKLGELHNEEEEAVKSLVQQGENLLSDLFIFIEDYIKKNIYKDFNSIFSGYVETALTAVLIDLNVDKNTKIQKIKKLSNNLKHYKRVKFMEEILEELE